MLGAAHVALLVRLSRVAPTHFLLLALSLRFMLWLLLAVAISIIIPVPVFRAVEAVIFLPEQLTLANESTIAQLSPDAGFFRKGRADARAGLIGGNKITSRVMRMRFTNHRR